jgi:hypothetical protein
VAKRSQSYLRAALLMPANLFALAAGGAASLGLHDWTPFLASAGASGIYLAMLSIVPSFRRVVASNQSAQELLEDGSPEERERLVAELAPSQREHWMVLGELREKILANYRQLPGGRVMAASSEPRLDGLLTSFLRLLSTLNSYRKYLNASDRKSIELELAGLEAEVAEETNPRLKDVKQRRAEILKKRIQRFAQAEESRQVVSHQLASIEDVLRLTHEQSIAIRDPEAVARQLEVLTTEVEATEETVREMERFMEFSEEAGLHPPSGVKVR